MSAQKTLAGFINKYDPAIRVTAREALAKMRDRLPGAMQLVYDTYNGLVVGFSPTDRASDAIFSIVLYPRWVNLFFLQGAGLPDPQNLLKGTGSRVRHIKIEDASRLDDPAVRALIKAALEDAVTPLTRKSGGKLILKSVQVKQRARRPGPSQAPPSRPARKKN